MRKQEKEKKEMSERTKRILKNLKKALFITMIILAFVLSERLAENLIYILQEIIDLGIIPISKFINTVLITTLCYIYFKKYKERAKALPKYRRF